MEKGSRGEREIILMDVTGRRGKGSRFIKRRGGGGEER